MDEQLYSEMLYITRSIQLHFWLYGLTCDDYYSDIMDRYIDGLVNLTNKLKIEVIANNVNKEVLK